MSESSAAVALPVGVNTAETFSFCAAATTASSTDPSWRLLVSNRGSQSTFMSSAAGLRPTSRLAVTHFAGDVFMFEASALIGLGYR